MTTTPTKEAIIGTFINGRNAQDDFLQLASNRGGTVFGWIDSDGHLQGSLANIGVTSINSLTGAITFAAGTNVTLVPSGNTLTINSTSAPGGSNTDVQYNNNGVLGGDAGFTYTPTSTTWSNLVAATSLANQNSPSLVLSGNVWTGSVSEPDYWTIQNVIGSGALPGQSLTFTPNLPNSVVVFNATLVTGQLNSGDIFATSLTLPAPVATSGGNGSSDLLHFLGSWWNGSAAVVSTTTIQEVVGIGTNPSEVLVISNSGAHTWTGVSILGGLTVSGNLNGAVISSQSTITASTDIIALQTSAATNIANFNSGNLKVIGNYWTGSASAADTWAIQDVLGTGSNPASTLEFTHSGSSGAATVQLPALTLTAATPTGTSGQLSFGTTTATSASAGSNGDVPAQVVGYLVLDLAGTKIKVPYYAT